MTYTVLIPARLASTRLPNKPLADIAGLPMIVRVAHQALKSMAAQVVVATDSAEVAAVCAAHKVAVVLTRSEHLSGSDRLAEAASLLALPTDAIVVNVQGDEPLIDPALIDAVASLLKTCPQADMGTAAHPIQNSADFHNPNVVKVVTDAQSLALYFSRAPLPFWRDAGPGLQSAQRAVPPNALRHIGIYSYRAGFLKTFPLLAPAPMEQIESLEQLRALWHGHKIAVHVTHNPPGMGVDTPEDLARIRALAW
jgi:3-deoxy-manno-octulosonate cytidylyltransferase (CMP-KDO synthetase)